MFPFWIFNVCTLKVKDPLTLNEMELILLRGRMAQWKSCGPRSLGSNLSFIPFFNMGLWQSLNLGALDISLHRMKLSTAFAFSGCHFRLLQSGWLRQQTLLSHRSGSLKLKCQQGWFLADALWEKSFLASSHLWWLLGILWLVPWCHNSHLFCSHSSYSCLLSLSVFFLSSSYKSTSSCI